jgi:hypothetical protein
MQQEVLNARMLKLHCIDIVVSHNALVQFQAVSTALQIVRSNEFEHDVKANSSHYSKRLAPAMNIPNSKHTLMKLLERTAILEATDSQDKLYTIMHLAHDYNEGSIPVDYERSVVDVMISAVRYFVEFQRTLDFLWQVDWDLERTNRASSDIQPNTTQDSDAAGEEHIPSWLPRWWDRSDVFLSKSEKLPIGKTMCLRQSLAADNKRLQVQGFCVDTIVQVLGWVNTLPNLTTREFGDIVRHLFYQDVPPQLRSTWCEVFMRSAPQLTTEKEILDIIQQLLDIAVEFEMSESYTAMSTMADVLGDLEKPKRDLITKIFDNLRGRMTFVTERFGLGKTRGKCMAQIDQVWVVLGCSAPLVLREVGNGYLHIGTARIKGLNDYEPLQGIQEEMQDGDKCGSHAVTTITLV